MDYSAINHVIYSMDFTKQDFVIGGHMAAGLLEPACAKLLGNSHGGTKLYISSTRFESLKDAPRCVYIPAQGSVEEYIVLSNGSLRILFHRGLPAWVTLAGGYRVVNPVALKHKLKMSGRVDLADLLHDEPYEVRAKQVVLTEAEEAFKKDCEQMDWYYSYSDDAAVYRKGAAKRKELEDRRDELGGNAHAIFDAESSK